MAISCHRAYVVSSAAGGRAPVAPDRAPSGPRPGRWRPRPAGSGPARRRGSSPRSAWPAGQPVQRPGPDGQVRRVGGGRRCEAAAPPARSADRGPSTRRSPRPVAGRRQPPGRAPGQDQLGAGQRHRRVAEQPPASLGGARDGGLATPGTPARPGIVQRRLGYPDVWLAANRGAAARPAGIRSTEDPGTRPGQAAVMAPYPAPRSRCVILALP